MKRNRKQLKFTLNKKHVSGGMLLEVVLAIAVFAFGMLALVQLQGNLTRSSADANTRTVATNIAEEIIENVRGFEQVAAIADNDKWEFLELTGNTLNETVTRGGMEYAVTVTIKDFWRDEANDTFVVNDATDPPTVPDGLGSLAYSSFKLMKIDVAWNTSQEFYVDDENTAQLGANNITLYEIIPNSPPILGAKIAANPNEAGNAPAVAYTPGPNPEIVALVVEDSGKRLKESTTPIPDIIRSGELTETYFEVVSYNQANVFARREEFLTVGCECTLNPNKDAPAFGLRPTVWNGVEYTEGAAVTVIGKNVGVSANNQQSTFCELCCRDHHDGGEAGSDGDFEDKRLVYNPWSASINTSVDHPHYGRTKKGEIFEAGDNDNYFESCRMVRRKGFWRVAQDFNQQGFFGVIENYMDNSAEVGEYSDYITTAVEEFYEKNQASVPQPGDPGMPEFTNPADGLKYPLLPATDDNAAKAGPKTNLPTALGVEEQQLRSRGLYVDYMTAEVKGKIDDCMPLGDDGNPPGTCAIPHFTDPLEVYPFFEVQLTSLSNWTEDPLNLPVDVTNEAIASSNAHSRGKAKLMQKGMGPTKSDHGIHKGNVGIAATDPIRPNDPQAADEDTDFVHIDTIDDGTAPISGLVLTGEFLSGVGGNTTTTNIELTYNEAQCGRTPTGYKCIVPTLAASPTMTVSGYYRKNKVYYACSDQLFELGQITGEGSFTTFDLSGLAVTEADIVIEDTPCANLPVASAVAAN